MERIHQSYQSLGDDGLRLLLRDLGQHPAQLTTVVELDLGGNQLTKAAGDLLAHFLQLMPNLEDLDLRDNKLRDGIWALVSAFPFRLQRLDLSGNYVRDYGVQCLGPWLISSNTAAAVELTDNQIGVPGALALAQVLQANHSLTRLSLAYNHLGDEGTAALARGLARNHCLQELDLSDNNIGDPGCDALARVLPNPGCALNSLNLSVNRIEQAGAYALGDSLQRNRTLTHLDIGCNPLGNTGAQAFADALVGNCTLLSLDLSTCQLGNPCAMALQVALAQNSTLTDLGLMCNGDMDIALMEPIFEKFRQNRALAEAHKKVGQASAKAPGWIVTSLPHLTSATMGIIVAAAAVALTLIFARRFKR